MKNWIDLLGVIVKDHAGLEISLCGASSWLLGSFKGTRCSAWLETNYHDEDNPGDIFLRAGVGGVSHQCGVPPGGHASLLPMLLVMVSYAFVPHIPPVLCIPQISHHTSISIYLTVISHKTKPCASNTPLLNWLVSMSAHCLLMMSLVPLLVSWVPLCLYISHVTELKVLLPFFYFYFILFCLSFLKGGTDLLTHQCNHVFTQLPGSKLCISYATEKK